MYSNNGPVPASSVFISAWLEGLLARSISRNWLSPKGKSLQGAVGHDWDDDLPAPAPSLWDYLDGFTEV